MAQPTPHITAAELRVLKVLWRLGAGTVRQVLDALPAGSDERPAYTTIMTIMKQLAGVNLESFLQDISRLPGAVAGAAKGAGDKPQSK